MTALFREFLNTLRIHTFYFHVSTSSNAVEFKFEIDLAIKS